MCGVWRSVEETAFHGRKVLKVAALGEEKKYPKTPDRMKTMKEEGRRWRRRWLMRSFLRWPAKSPVGSPSMAQWRRWVAGGKNWTVGPRISIRNSEDPTAGGRLLWAYIFSYKGGENMLLRIVQLLLLVKLGLGEPRLRCLERRRLQLVRWRRNSKKIRAQVAPKKSISQRWGNLWILVRGKETRQLL